MYLRIILLNCLEYSGIMQIQVYKKINTYSSLYVLKGTLNYKISRTA